MSVRAWFHTSVVCLVAVATTAVAPAWAERKPVLIVDGTADRTGADAVRGLDEQLGRELVLGPVATDVLTALTRPPTVDNGWQAELAAAATAAKDELARFGYREAADHARGALDRFAFLAQLPAAKKQLAELALVEGQALVGAGATDQAILTLRLVQVLDPGRTLDPARYLPEVTTAYLAAGRPPTGSGTLSVSAPGAAEILVDGVVAGAEPLTITVAPGPHLISARGEAIVTVGRRIDAPAGEAIRIDLVPLVAPLDVRVNRVLTRLRAAADDRALADAVAGLLGLSQARDAVVVVHGATGLATRLYTARAGLAPARPLEEPATTLAPLRPLVVTAPKVIKRHPPPPPVGPWYRQRWGKTTIGLSVAAVLAGIVTAMVVRDPGTSTLIGRPVVD